MNVSKYIAAALLFVSAGAFADDKATTPEKAKDVNSADTLGHGEKSENLPPSESSHDPLPPVAAPANPGGTGVVKQAGVGGEVAYGRVGVLELGGSAGVTASSDFTNLTFSPSIGWFFQDNLQLSGIVNVNFNNVGGATNTFVSVLAEPSYHLPFTQQVFGFLGFGIGVGYAGKTASGPAGVGLAIAPRLGANVLLGRSGILTPAAFFNYSTVGVSNSGGSTTLTVKPTYGLQIGYTVML